MKYALSYLLGVLLIPLLIIFPICFDLGDFLYPEFPTDEENNHTGSKKDTK